MYVSYDGPCSLSNFIKAYAVHCTQIINEHGHKSPIKVEKDSSKFRSHNGYKNQQLLNVKLISKSQ